MKRPKHIENLLRYIRERRGKVPEEQLRSEVREKLLRIKLKKKALEEVKRNERRKVAKDYVLLKRKYDELVTKVKTARTISEKQSLEKQIEDLRKKIETLKKLYRSMVSEEFMIPEW
ncbi:MAG: hypothetical protein QW734_03830 [Candidatus Bathyarchaeia archaeon]